MRLLAVIPLLIATAVNLAAQSSAPWHFWNTADGYVESYTSSLALNPDGTVWVKHGAVSPLDLLNGYYASKRPEPGGYGQLEIAPDGALWI